VSIPNQVIFVFDKISTKKYIIILLI